MNGMRVSFDHRRLPDVGSVPEFLGAIRRLRTQSEITTATWFRGASKACYQPLPTIGCPHSYADIGNRDLDWVDERNILHRFRRRAYQHSGRLLDSWEALFLARHYFLPARILDWTAHPLAALWFACSTDPHENAALWCIARTETEEFDLDVVELARRPGAESEGFGPLEIYTQYTIDDGAIGQVRDMLGDVAWLGELEKLKGFYDRGCEFFQKATKILGRLFSDHRAVLLKCARDQSSKNPSEHDAVKILHPFYNSPRITAQGGAFTFHSNPWIELTKYAKHPFLVERLDIKGLFEWNVPAGKKAGILRELELYHGMKREVLFPDLDGLSKGLLESILLAPKRAGLVP